MSSCPINVLNLYDLNLKVVRVSKNVKVLIEYTQYRSTRDTVCRIHSQLIWVLITF